MIQSVTLVSAWPLVGGQTWIAPSWSVSLELLAYMALPLALPVVRRLSPRWAMVLGVACLVGFMAAVLANGDHDPNVKARGGMVRLACEFLAGSAFYRVWRAGRRVPVRAGCVAAVSLLAIALFGTVPETAFAILPATVLIIFLASQDDGAITRSVTGWLGWFARVSPFLGRISYSLYLVHWPAIVVFRHFGGFDAGPLAAAAFFFAVLAAASMLHYAVEAPSHRWARRLRFVGSVPAPRSAIRYPHSQLQS